jgi:hypothetical protein
VLVVAAVGLFAALGHLDLHFHGSVVLRTVGGGDRGGLGGAELQGPAGQRDKAPAAG